MRIGGSLALIAIGAILKWAITAQVNGVDLGLIGVILMVVGVIGFIASVLFMASRRRTDIVHRDVGMDGQPTERRTTYITPNGPDADL